MKQIAIPIMILLCTNVVHAQNRISGTVKDSETQKAISGATVTVKGKSLITRTNERGEYTLSATPNETLVFTYLGFKQQSILVGDKRSINIELQRENNTLDEVVIIGYGTAKKADLTGFISSVKGSAIVDRPGTNPIANLQGKVPGLQVTNSGRPGQEPDIRIRGTNSINGAKPLYVVDGLLNDNINFLNPNDIENIEVLRDASSLAIFGVRGANGAIVITTKKAKSGDLSFDFNTRIGVKNVSTRMDMLNATEFKELYDEQRFNQGDYPYDYSNWTANTDWQDQIFRNALLNYNNLSVSGASDKNTFRMGLGYAIDEGLIKNEKHNQITLNLADEVKLTDNFRTGIVVNGYRSRLPQNRGVFSSILAAPIAPVFNEEYGLYHTLPDFQRAQVFNPLIDIEDRKDTYIGINYRAITNLYAEVDFLKNFSFRVNLSADYGFNNFRSYQGLVSVYNPDIQGNDKRERVGNLLTSVSHEQNTHYKYQTDWLLHYKNNFGKHNLNLTGGYTTYLQGLEATNVRRTQGDGIEIPNDPDYWYVNIGDVKTTTGNSSASEFRTISWLGRALYNYDNKYLLNASYRRDGSSAFAKNGKPWQNFYSFGAAWVVSQESFMQDVEAINNLKLKGSWGSLGNQNTGGNRYPMYPQMVAGNSAVFGEELIPAYEAEYIPDPNLRWEIVKSWEAGLELSAFLNRLNVEAVYYKKNTNDVLVTVPGILGSRPGLSNLGNIENKGLEASVSWTQQVNDDWRFSIGGNITTVKNKVLKLSSEGYDIIQGASRTIAGYPIGYFWGYVHDGIFQTQTEVNQYATNGLGGGAFLSGDIKYKDLDGNGVIDTKDRTMIGNPTPDFYYGISLSSTYKNFDLGIELQGLYGNEILRTWNQNQFATYNFLRDRLGRWNGEGTSNWEPIAHEGRAVNRQYSTYFIEDGSFFRIRDITLGYNLSQEATRKMRLRHLRLFINVQNLATFSNNTGFTPEIGGSTTSFGVDNGTYPVPAIYTFGINLNF